MLTDVNILPIKNLFSTANFQNNILQVLAIVVFRGTFGYQLQTYYNMN